MTLQANEPQALAICGLLSPESRLIKEIDVSLEELLGPVQMHSEVLPFTWTDYYDAEMGEGILRRWVVFSRLLDLTESWRWKKETCEVEKRYTRKGNRSINIDPGFIRLDGLWLFSTKPAGHRAYLAEGIWIELTLRFLREGCEDMPWTYPDHRGPVVQSFFLKAREELKRRLPDV